MTVTRSRTHNLLLLASLLNLRDTSSPLALVLDSLEQPAVPLLTEYIRRAKLAKTHVTYVSFETFERPEGVDSFISAARKKANDITNEVIASFPPNNAKIADQRCLVIVDSVHHLVRRKGVGKTADVPGFLTSLLGPTSKHFHISVVAVCHQDLPASRSSHSYSPTLLALLTYLATTIFTVHSIDQVLARKAAADKSMVTPLFGLDEEREGVLIGGRPSAHVEEDEDEGSDDDNGGEDPDEDDEDEDDWPDGFVVEMEHRRKSGRSVVEWYFIPPPSQISEQAREVAIPLEEHPLYQQGLDHGPHEGDEEPSSTFELKLTERQRRDRENVVLPYFDAQNGEGPGEGGRILYDMGEEDDFDEEEDEI